MEHEDIPLIEIYGTRRVSKTSTGKVPIDMPDMLFFQLGVNENIIDEDHDKSIEFLHKYGIHQVHEISRSISETK